MNISDYEQNIENVYDTSWTRKLRRASSQYENSLLVV